MGGLAGTVLAVCSMARIHRSDHPLKRVDNGGMDGHPVSRSPPLRRWNASQRRHPQFDLCQPQLVDGESTIFCLRTLLELHKTTGEAENLAAARRAAEMVVTWIRLWDVPLPAESTLARRGFRSTGWMACDAPGAGYIHPMGLLAVPDLVEIGLLTGDDHFLDAAELLQAGCNETVETAFQSWGYARPGLQEEGLLISWWFADDPMFAETAFGGRGKGEGNRTCLRGYRQSAYSRRTR